MAVGDQYNNNKKKSTNVLTYSLVNFSNPTGVDQTKISIDFWGNLLKVSIAPKSEKSSGDYASYDHENAGAMYLSHIKVRQLAGIISKYLEDSSLEINEGVRSKNSIISFHNSLAGSDGACLAIRTFNDAGQLESSYAYEFKNDFHYSLKEFDSLQNEKKTYNNLVEIQAFNQSLIQFADVINGAIAHTVLEYGKFENSRMQTKLNGIAKKLGIEWAQEGAYNSTPSAPRRFDAAGSSPSVGKSYSLDEI